MCIGEVFARKFPRMLTVVILLSFFHVFVFDFLIMTGVSWWLSDKESACTAGDIGDMGSIPVLGRSPGGGHGNPLQYSCLENLMDRGAWWATVHGVAKSQTWLKVLSTAWHESLL